MTSMNGDIKHAEKKLTYHALGRVNEDPCGRALTPHDGSRRRKCLKQLLGPKGLCLAMTTTVLILIATLCWTLHSVIAPARSIPVPTAPTHFHVTLPASEVKRRYEYMNNTFMQMLHQHQLVVNTTECWVCGLLPASAASATPYIPYPFSCPGSASTWYAVLRTAYFQRPATRNKPDLGTRDPAMKKATVDLGRTCTNNTANATAEEIAAYERRNQTYYVRYFTGKTEYLHTMSVLSRRAPHCIRGLGRNRLGDSECDKVTVLNDTIPPALVASQRTCFICGTNGYTWLPADWSGTCYIAFLLPPTFSAGPDFHERHYSHRSKRGVIDTKDTAGQESGDFAKGFFPFWGPMVNSRHIRQLTRVVETTIDITAGALSNVTAELRADRLMTLQNRVVLDVILADRGGVCTVIGSSCCVYIPDDAPTVYQAIKKLHILDESIRSQEGTWSLASWTWSTITAWGRKILIIVGVTLAAVFTCCLCLQCLPTICSVCISSCTPKRINIGKRNEHMMLQRETDHIMNIDPE